MSVFLEELAPPDRVIQAAGQLVLEGPPKKAGEEEPVCSICGFHYEPDEGVFVRPDSTTSYFICCYCLRDVINDLINPEKPEDAWEALIRVLVDEIEKRRAQRR